MKLKPHCDLATGKVYGCKRGSWYWYHEKGHFEFNRREDTSFLILLRGYLFDVWLFSLMIAILYNQIVYVSICLWVLYFFLFMYEEYWCNKYADYRTTKK